MSKLLISIAMEAEAAPLISALKLTPSTGLLPSALPFVSYEGDNMTLITSGKDAVTGVDNVGTIPAALSVSHALATGDYNTVVNCGTCGGFIKRGMSIGSVMIPTVGAFHDRRIVIPGTKFEEYGVGKREVTNAKAALVREELGYVGGCCTTGDSLDHVPTDDAQMEANEAVAKDMEFASIAQVCSLYGVDLVGVKVVTDLVDGDKPSFEEFMENLGTAAKSLQETIPKVIEVLAKK
ncbi:hypothetical protein TrLO_g9669 [Triparma laevis f. longispina]|uniref:Nucleoside phosphorylase domain-containing protein n=1 Tax=Triparma laevis f. longispina TaxID=1714387 RepID=A0A9W7C918_9STRA|nr:hypothetical protein TrLO_g9669 [Triparma laevis f. longispina]